MTAVAILDLLVRYGPSILPLIQQTVAWIENDKKEVTSDDIAELIAMSKVTSSQIYADAGVTPPPHAPAATPV